MRFCFLKLFFLVVIANAYGQSRLSPKLQRQNLRAADQPIFLSVSVRDENKFQKKYEGKITIRNVRQNIFYIVADNHFIDAAIADDNIIFIDHPGRPVTEASIDFFNTAFNRINKVHAKFSDLSGTARNISIKEKLFDTTSIDLINRSFRTAVSSTEISQHATAMATLIAGGDNSSSKSLGVAPEAEITSSDFDNLLPDPDEIFVNYDIYLQNHSYGVLIENYYGNEAAAYDDQVFSQPNLLHIFSAGNIGHSNPIDGTYAGLPFANLSGNFKQSKNTLSVTAVDTTFLMNSLNSRGPAYDGRLKPELTAYGQGGTSEAAALVSGTSALIQQKIKSMNGTEAWASTIKAILITTADDLGPTGIDYTYGYGNLNAYKAIQLLEKIFPYEISLGSQGTRTISVDVGDSVTQIKIAVVWSDPPAIQNSNVALIHDIDSYLTDGVNIFYPWMLNSFANIDSLTAPAKRKQDHLNNVEYFTIDNPSPGNYSLQITAPTLTTDAQNISIAIWLEKKTFEWDYPNAKDVLKANTKETLLWNSPEQSQGEIYVQLNNGDWQPVASSLDLSAYFKWSVPDTFAIARLKMITNAKEYVSDEFMISPEPTLHVAYNCDNDALLSWAPTTGADGYEVFSMGEKYLEKKVITTDTTYQFSKPSPDSYFAVAPLLAEQKGMRSQTINYQEQGTYCYIDLFGAERFESSSVTVQLKLSTLINVEKINIYKSTSEGQSLLTSFPPDENLFYNIHDTDLQSGVIDYTAEVVLKDGSKIHSDVSEVLIETKDKIILYPNPLTDQELLSALSEGNGTTLEIFSNTGQRVMTVDLELTLEIIPANQLHAGIYFYHAIKNHLIIDTGKFIKY